MKDLIAQQIVLENECYNMSLDKYESNVSKAMSSTRFVDSQESLILFKASIDTLIEYLNKYKKMTLKQDNKEIREILLASFPQTKDLAYVLLRVVLSLLIEGDGKATALGRKASTSIQHYLRTALMSEAHVKAVERQYKRYNTSTRKRKLMVTASSLVTLDISPNKSILLGTTVLDLVYKSGCNIVEKYPKTDALYLGLSEEAKMLLLKSKLFFSSILTIHYPFIVPPRDWIAIEGSGGYYTNKSIKFIKTRNNKDYSIIKEHNPNVDRLLGVINKIQNSSFRINKDMLEIMDYICSKQLIDHSSPQFSPYLLGKIPYYNGVRAYDVVKKEAYGKTIDGKFTNVDNFKTYARAVDLQEELISRNIGRRNGFDLAKSIATRFKDYKEIFFSYNVDFRGRLYPIQQYLSPQGSDFTKPMLEFGRGKKLTERGVYWLKIQGANSLGYDKLPYKDRVAKIDALEEEIKLIHSDPLAYTKLWYNVDSPLAYLAFAISYGSYLVDPECLCHAGVALDATCSGIQVYSGLLLDKEGAKAVNVINTEDGRVSDIYGIVALKVEEYLAKGDYPNSYSFTTNAGVSKTLSTAVEASSIKGKITRNVTKHNTMTQPYSVTRRGMFEQVYSLLQEYEENNKVFWKGDKWVVATLISELNDKAITEIVKGAKVGQHIIKEVMKEALVNNDYVYWETPIYHFPVLQRIKKETMCRLRTPLGHLVLYNPTDETHYLKMLNGIAPNFIHSIDATLLYRTCELCFERGIDSIWLIHDSYCVHPNDVDTLNECFREAFVELFGSKPLYQWANQLIDNADELLDKVMLNDLEIDDVLSSNYIIT